MQVEVTNETHQPKTACFRTYPPRSTQIIECGRKQYHRTLEAGLRVEALDSDPGPNTWGKRSLSWIVSGGIWQAMLDDPLVAEKLAGDTVYGQNATPDRGPFPEGVNVVGLTFEDKYDIIVEDFHAGKYPPGHAVCFVMENSEINSSGPEVIENLEYYAGELKDLLHSGGVTLLHSIALTAATYLDPQKRGENEAGWAFIDERLAYRGALHADVFQAQAQRILEDVPAYRAMVRAAAAQGGARGRKIPILAALTTTNSRLTTEDATKQELVTAFYEALPYCDGHWFNCPVNQELGTRNTELLLSCLREAVW